MRDGATGTGRAGGGANERLGEKDPRPGGDDVIFLDSALQLTTENPITLNLINKQLITQLKW